MKTPFSGKKAEVLLGMWVVEVVMWKAGRMLAALTQRAVVVVNLGEVILAAGRAVMGDAQGRVPDR